MPTLFKIHVHSECFRTLAEEMCKDGIVNTGYDNIFNAICRWPVTNCI